MPLLGVGDGWLVVLELVLVVEDDTEEEEEEEGEVVVAEEEVGTVPVGVGVASVRKITVYCVWQVEKSLVALKRAKYKPVAKDRTKQWGGRAQWKNAMKFCF